MTAPPPTVAWLRAEGIGIWAWCNSCSHSAALTVPAGLPDHMPVPSIATRLRCSACGGRDVYARPDWKVAPSGNITLSP